MKGIGVGVTYPLAEIDVPHLPGDGVVRLPAGGAPHEVTWTLHTMELPSGYTLSVAVAGAGGEVAVIGAVCLGTAGAGEPGFEASRS